MSLIVEILTIGLSFIASAVLTAIYVLLVWWIDRYEKEPLKLLVYALLWGAIPAGVLSFVFEAISQGPLLELSPVYGAVVDVSLVAPIIEEYVKGLALLGLFWLARQEFDDTLDGIVYGSIIGFGFAMTENVLYFRSAWMRAGVAGWTFVFLGRSLAFGLNHAMFTSFTGVGFGLARYERSRRRRVIFVALGLMAAITGHVVHNLFAASGLCVVSFLADWVGVLVVIVIIVLAWRREKAWMIAELPEEVSLGVLTPLQFETVSSRRNRLRQGWHLLGISGLRQAALWRQLVDASTELAFKKHQHAKMGEEKGNSTTIAALRGKILRLRQELGDEAAAQSRICAACGLPSAKDAGLACPHCQTPWAES